MARNAGTPASADHSQVDDCDTRDGGRFAIATKKEMTVAPFPLGEGIASRRLEIDRHEPLAITSPASPVTLSASTL
jgi:hypothetical protein